MKYELPAGEILYLSLLPKQDVGYLLCRRKRGTSDKHQFDLQRRVCGLGAYRLKSSRRATPENHDLLLFRAGIWQGSTAPDLGDECARTDGIMRANEAATAPRVARSAVIKTTWAGRMKGKKIGQTWAVRRRSVERYEVAQHRMGSL